MKKGSNPEVQLIELVVDQIVDDEKLIENLGSGALSLDEVEAWYRGRQARSDRFLDECGRLVKEMRRQGFGRLLRREPRARRRHGSGAPRGGAAV